MMKKFLKLCACGFMAAALLTGCSGGGAAETKETEETTTAAETTAETAVVPETVAMIDLSNIGSGAITLGDYKGIEVVKELAEVDEAQVEKEVLLSLAANAEYAEVERPVQLSDKVNIDYEGTKDGVAFDGGTAQGADLTIGSDSFIPGFEDGLIGAKKGEEVVLPLTFPEAYQNADLAGKAVEFKVKINSVQGFTADDALVGETTDYKTLDEYKESVREGLLTDAENQSMNQIQSKILETVVNNSTITPSEEAIDANYQNYVAQYTNQAAGYGVDLATMATAFFGMDEETFKSQLKVMSQAAVEQRLVFTAIAEKENIAVSDDDRAALAVQMGYESKEAMTENAGAYTVDDYIISTKVMDFLVENAVIK